MKRYLCILVLALLLLGGCRMNREYLSVTPHEEQYVEQENADAIVVSDYDGLVSALLQLCSRRDTTGVIRVYGYPGEIVEDAPKAVYHVAKQSAVGAYAVDYITYDCTQVVSYYEITVHITYTKTLEELQALISTRGENAIRQRISKAMQEYADTLTLRVYGGEVYDAESYVQQYYMENPGLVQVCPQVQVTHYPRQVTNEYVLELHFTYPYTKEQLQQFQTEVDAVIASAVDYVQYREQEEEKLQLLYMYLSERFEYRLQNSDTPVYSVLCEGTANSEAFACTMKVLCEAIGLECLVVRGSYNEESWAWNIVKTDGQYYHMDPMRAVMAGEVTLSLELDSAMNFYSWSREAYPACTLRPDGAIDMREDDEGTANGEFGENVD